MRIKAGMTSAEKSSLKGSGSGRKSKYSEMVKNIVEMIQFPDELKQTQLRDIGNCVRLYYYPCLI